MTWRDDGGQTYSVEDPGQRPAIIHFWAAWCSPCVKELPDLAGWRKAHPGIAVIPLSMDKKFVQANSMLQRSGADLPLWLVDKKSLGSFKIRALPLTLVVDQEGQILHRIEGPAPWGEADFTDKMRCLLEPRG